MRVIALEEHFTAPGIVGRIDRDVVRQRGFQPRRVAPGADGVAMARELNDHLAAACARHPDRFAGFAALPSRA